MGNLIRYVSTVSLIWSHLLDVVLNGSFGSLINLQLRGCLDDNPLLIQLIRLHNII